MVVSLPNTERRAPDGELVINDAGLSFDRIVFAGIDKLTRGARSSAAWPKPQRLGLFIGGRGGPLPTHSGPYGAGMTSSAVFQHCT